MLCVVFFEGNIVQVKVKFEADCKWIATVLHVMTDLGNKEPALSCIVVLPSAS